MLDGEISTVFGANHKKINKYNLCAKCTACSKVKDCRWFLKGYI